jgi:TRAP-type C4-dicarboxylate transport system substrate-binding protein
VVTRLVAVLAVLLLSTGCAAGGPVVDKAGVPVGPVTLRAWSPEAQDRPSGMQLTAFVEAVGRLSGGAMRIDATYGNDQADPHPETTVIEAVQRGAYDIGLLASRAFSSVGVDSLKAFTAPFLIQTDAVADAVSRDEGVTGPMLNGLHEAGLVGLAVVPETIRHPFGTLGPILTPADYRGAVLRSLPSKETYAVFEALGAKPGFWDGDIGVAKLQDGSIKITETSFAIATDSTGTGQIRTATGNVAFFPRMNVLFANKRTADGLSAEQRGVLDRAAVEAREQTIATQPKDAAAAAEFCASGGRVVLADPADVAALQKAVAPYLATLAEDPTTSDALTGIGAIVKKTPEPDPVQACEPSGAQSENLAPWPVTNGPSPIDGRYRVQISDADLQAAGMRRAAWPYNRGTYTWVIADGRMTSHQVAPDSPREGSEQEYVTVRGRQVMLMSLRKDGSAPTNHDVVLIATWSRGEDGTLTFSDCRRGLGSLPGDEATWCAKPFTALR